MDVFSGDGGKAGFCREGVSGGRNVHANSLTTVIV
jgi:hypothetical protein